MKKWFKENQRGIIRNSFLLPILLVVAMSISHVIAWYDIGNPFSWAVYLSVAIEIFALASVSAASIKASKGTIWFLFGIVTLIQIVGNVFYEFKEINIESKEFIAWVDLIGPMFSSLDWNMMDHRRLLATFQGGTLPIMSLTSLHFYLQFTEQSFKEDEPTIEELDERADEVIASADEGIKEAEETIAEAEEAIKELDEEWDEDHAHDMVMNDMVSDMDIEDFKDAEEVPEVDLKIETREVKSDNPVIETKVEIVKGDPEVEIIDKPEVEKALEKEIEESLVAKRMKERTEDKEERVIEIKPEVKSTQKPEKSEEKSTQPKEFKIPGGGPATGTGGNKKGNFGPPNINNGTIS